MYGFNTKLALILTNQKLSGQVKPEGLAISDE